jgi:hypothetical protein
VPAGDKDGLLNRRRSARGHGAKRPPHSFLSLVTNGTDRYILTAAHVVERIDIANMRFWFRPPAAMVEMPAKETTTNK